MNQSSCQGAVGDTALKPVKHFVVLTQANLHSSSLAEQDHCLCYANCQLCLPLSQLKHYWPHNFQVFLPVLLVKWDQKILFTVCVAMSLAPLDGKVRGCCTFNFPNRLSGWEMLGAALILPYILTPLPIHSKGSLQTRHQLCSGGNQLCLPQLEHFWPAYLPGVITSPSAQMSLEDTLHSRCDSASCLGEQTRL